MYVRRVPVDIDKLLRRIKRLEDRIKKLEASSGTK